MPIYTKTGDKGETGLFGGKRVSKSSQLVDAYGLIDELNSWIGLVISELPKSEKKIFLQKIQSDLFAIGGSFAGAGLDLGFIETRVTEMEVEIDTMEKDLEPLSSFILPGGSRIGATIHVTRSVCRRVERRIVSLSEQLAFNADIIKYFNRLSDLFFVFARYINKQTGASEVVWSGQQKNK